MNTCETRVMNSDYEDKSRRAEYVIVQMTSIIGEKVEEFSGILRPWISEFSVSRALYSTRGALPCGQARAVVSGSEIEQLWKKRMRVDDSAGRL